MFSDSFTWPISQLPGTAPSLIILRVTMIHCSEITPVEEAFTVIKLQSIERYGHSQLIASIHNRKSLHLVS